MEDRLQQGANKWRSELFDHRPVLEKEESMEKGISREMGESGVGSMDAESGVE